MRGGGRKTGLLGNKKQPGMGRRGSREVLIRLHDGSETRRYTYDDAGLKILSRGLPPKPTKVRPSLARSSGVKLLNVS
jgi:hypothetical protein